MPNRSVFQQLPVLSFYVFDKTCSNQLTEVNYEVNTVMDTTLMSIFLFFSLSVNHIFQIYLKKNQTVFFFFPSKLHSFVSDKRLDQLVCGQDRGRETHAKEHQAIWKPLRFPAKTWFYSCVYTHICGFVFAVYFLHCCLTLCLRFSSEDVRNWFSSLFLEEWGR